MKNKKVVILLLVLAAGVWGTVLYKIFKAVGKSDDVQLKVSERKSDILSSLKDTFSIVADYRDPFMGKRPLELPKKVVSSEPRPKPVPVATAVKWPSVRYSGMIRNQAKELALVKIDQKNLVMKAGDSMSGVELKNIFRDSIVVFYQKEKKVIIK